VDEVDGPARPLAPSVDLTAYRLIQEALTNACKHAGPTAEVNLRLSYRHDGLGVTVQNGPYRSELREGGHGIAGMHQCFYACELLTQFAPRMQVGKIFFLEPTFFCQRHGQRVSQCEHGCGGRRGC
jgi:glucose-6-phosphate-specific signal transduction histidine kinase